MNKEDLLKERYKVIADYPKSLYHVGDILNAGWRSEDCIYCDTEGPRWRHYPHLFKKLFWWEERDVNDMPEYLQYLPNGDIIKVDRYEITTDVWFYSKSRTGQCRLPHYEPATYQEYESFIKQPIK